MPDQSLYVVLAENFYDLIFSAYLIILGKKLKVVAEKELLENSQSLLLLDPFRSRLLCGRLGLPLKKEKDPFLPDFQLISSKYRLDFFWDRSRREFAFKRDLGPAGLNLLAFINQLGKRGMEFELRIKEFPLLSPSLVLKFFRGFTSRAKNLVFQQNSLASAVTQAGISPELSQIILAPLRVFSPYFNEKSPFLSSALLWRFLLSADEGITTGGEIQTSFLEILTASASLLTEEPISLESEGKRLRELKFHSGRKIQPDFLFASPAKVLELLNEKERETKSARTLAQRFPRASIFSHFYELKKEYWHEAMAERILWISSRQEPPSEFLLCAIPLTPATNLVSITYARRKGEARPLKEEDLWQTLGELFPWLKGQALPSLKEQIIFHQYLPLDSSQFFYPRIQTPFVNLYLLPSELVPLLGLAGLFHLAETFSEQEKEK